LSSRGRFAGVWPAKTYKTNEHTLSCIGILEPSQRVHVTKLFSDRRRRWPQIPCLLAEDSQAFDQRRRTRQTSIRFHALVSKPILPVYQHFAFYSWRHWSLKTVMEGCVKDVWTRELTCSPQQGSQIMNHTSTREELSDHSSLLTCTDVDLRWISKAHPDNERIGSTYIH